MWSPNYGFKPLSKMKAVPTLCISCRDLSAIHLFGLKMRTKLRLCMKFIWFSSLATHQIVLFIHAHLFWKYIVLHQSTIALFWKSKPFNQKKKNFCSLSSAVHTLKWTTQWYYHPQLTRCLCLVSQSLKSWINCSWCSSGTAEKFWASFAPLISLQTWS